MKLVFAKQQSYIQTKDPVDGKWKLLVAVSEKQSPDHKTIIELIRQEKPKNKKLARSGKSQLQTLQTLAQGKQ